jgi:hypothetical protein
MQLPIRRGQTPCLPRLDESSCMRLIDGLNCGIRVSKEKPARGQCMVSTDRTIARCRRATRCFAPEARDATQVVDLSWILLLIFVGTRQEALQTSASTAGSSSWLPQPQASSMCDCMNAFRRSPALNQRFCDVLQVLSSGYLSAVETQESAAMGAARSGAQNAIAIHFSLEDLAERSSGLK